MAVCCGQAGVRHETLTHHLLPKIARRLDGVDQLDAHHAAVEPGPLIVQRQAVAVHSKIGVRPTFATKLWIKIGTTSLNFAPEKFAAHQAIPGGTGGGAAQLARLYSTYSSPAFGCWAATAESRISVWRN